MVSRESGSGTRGAFVELIGVVDEEDNDMTTQDATISNSTEVVIQTVAGNTGAIGYISLGSLDDTVKGVNIDGVEPTAENIENGTYTVSRPFNVATKGELTNEAAQDFMNYIMSEEGQAIVAEDYIPISGVEAFESNGASGSVTVSGSSSVSPLMQKLIEGYNTVNPNVSIELQTGRRPGEHRYRHRRHRHHRQQRVPHHRPDHRAGSGHLPGQHHRLVRAGLNFRQSRNTQKGCKRYSPFSLGGQ